MLRMLSISAVDASSSSSSISRLKKSVGGICRVSPTTTTCFPRMIAPNASTAFTWEASSNTTTSNSTLPGGRKFAIDIGLIMNTGLIC
ncbi:hypothetical protein D3C80_1629770 [compost metagenome]